jgi:hypothetical protein
MHALLPPPLKPSFTFLSITTSFVRLFQSGLQKHSAFDKVFLMVTYFLDIIHCLVWKGTPLVPPKWIYFRHCVRGLYHVLVCYVNWEFLLNQCLCEFDLWFSLRVSISASFSVVLDHGYFPLFLLQISYFPLTKPDLRCIILKYLTDVGYILIESRSFYQTSEFVLLQFVTKEWNIHFMQLCVLSWTTRS